LRGEIVEYLSIVMHKYNTDDFGTVFGHLQEFRQTSQEFCTEESGLLPQPGERYCQGIPLSSVGYVSMTSDITPKQAIGHKPRRARREPPFRPSDVKRAIKGALAAGVKDPTVRVELPDGTSIVISSAPAPVPASPGNPLDEWREKRRAG
jgi:hypothetical protein